MEDNEMIVEFDKWCQLCKHEKLSELKMPCFECLDNPVNINTTKPVLFTPKGE